jgi:aryl-alcohol dehydrogenase-like predicted oxidoreductase
VETDILPFCRLENIGVIVYSPMYNGLLSGTMTRERIRGFPDNDWRKFDSEFKEPNLARNFTLVERLKAVAAHYQRTAAEVAIAWTLHHTAVTGAIVGVRSARQADGVMCAGELVLTRADAAFLRGEA